MVKASPNSSRAVATTPAVVKVRAAAERNRSSSRPSPANHRSNSSSKLRVKSKAKERERESTSKSSNSSKLNKLRHPLAEAEVTTNFFRKCNNSSSSSHLSRPLDRLLSNKSRHSLNSRKLRAVVESINKNSSRSSKRRRKSWRSKLLCSRLLRLQPGPKSAPTRPMALRRTVRSPA